MGLFYEDVLRALDRNNVKFVLVGGLAVILHGVPRTTADIDIVADLEMDNLRRLVETMESLGFRPRAPVPAAELMDPLKRQDWIEEKGMQAFTFVRPGRPLDELDVLIAGVPAYDELAENAEAISFEGLTFQLASAEDLIRMKRGTGRAHDQADADALRRILEAEDE